VTTLLSLTKVCDSDGSAMALNILTGYFVGSFYEPWARNANNASLRAYIEAYVATQVYILSNVTSYSKVTQYNALQDLASAPGSSYYNGDWHGPAINYWTKPGITGSTPVLAIAAAISPSTNDIV
jgi:hypothetical protein